MEAKASTEHGLMPLTEACDKKVRRLLWFLMHMRDRHVPNVPPPVPSFCTGNEFTNRIHRLAPAHGKTIGSRAVTLVELMIALGLLAMLAVSVGGITFQIRSTAEQGVYQDTALILAQGYMEQIRHLDYTTLSAVAQDNGSTKTVPLPLDKISGTPINAGGNVLFNGSWYTETVYLDQAANGTPKQPMPFQFQPVLTSLEKATGNVASGVEITVNYSFTYDFGVKRTVNGSLRSVRSSVPTY